jgi:hypothetical protein
VVALPAVPLLVLLGGVQVQDKVWARDMMRSGSRTTDSPIPRAIRDGAIQVVSGYSSATGVTKEASRLAVNAGDSLWSNYSEQLLLNAIPKHIFDGVELNRKWLRDGPALLLSDQRFLLPAAERSEGLTMQQGGGQNLWQLMRLGRRMRAKRR